jgi:predicted acetyltransferase
MMMRVVDFRAYCSSIRIPSECHEELLIKLIDKECPWNEGTFRLKAEQGEIILSEEEEGMKPDITLDPHLLSLVIGGKSRASVLLELGMIDCSAETVGKLEAIFPPDNFISYFRF